jgi:uncharacterized protein (DUF983 family)
MKCAHCSKPIKWQKFINWSSTCECDNCKTKLHYQADLIATVLAIGLGLVIRKLLFPISTIITVDLFEISKTTIVVVLVMLIVQVAGMMLGLGKISEKK